MITGVSAAVAFVMGTMFRLSRSQRYVLPVFPNSAWWFEADGVDRAFAMCASMFQNRYVTAIGSGGSRLMMDPVIPFRSR